MVIERAQRNKPRSSSPVGLVLRRDGRTLIRKIILDKTSASVRRYLLVGVSALAVVLVAAVADPDPNLTRIRAMPADQRARLLQNLRKFDLELNPEKQQVIREIDRKIGQLDVQEGARYFWVLRRYHDWLKNLPDNKQEEVLAQSTDNRLPTIRKLIAQYPVPTTETPELLQVAEVGELSPFELASAYRIWIALNPSQRERVEHKAQGRGRRKSLFEFGSSLKTHIPKETKPADFIEDRWIGQVEDYFRKSRPVMWVNDPMGNDSDDVAKRKQESIRNIHRHQAINLYTIRTPVHSVDPEKLTQFVVALPAWLQTGIDSYPPDEARRRLTWAYRLVFKYPDEIDSTSHPASSPLTAPHSTQTNSVTIPAKRKPSPTTPSSTPF